MGVGHPVLSTERVVRAGLRLALLVLLLVGTASAARC